MQNQLKSKVALVTGAGSGLGRASAMKMASRGACVVVSDLNLESAEKVADEISNAGGNAIAIICDIGNEDNIENAIEKTVSHFGKINILHNNAALLSGAALEADVDILTIPTEMWDSIMQVTLRGTMLGCRYGVKAMLKTGGGSIINTSSMYGMSAFNQMTAYGVSKGAINTLTEYVATSFGRKGIRCNAVAPSMIKTPMLVGFVPEEVIKFNEDATLTPFLGEPDDIANIVAFLASDDSRYLTGQIIRADGGTTAHLPTYSDARRYYGDD